MANKTGEERRIFLFKNFGKLIKINYKNPQEEDIGAYEILNFF